MAKNRYVHVRLSEQDERWIKELADDYNMDKSKLVMLALGCVKENRPQFVIRSQDKEREPA